MFNLSYDVLKEKLDSRKTIVIVLLYSGFCNMYPCSNGGECTGQGNSLEYECTCREGYTGQYCETSEIQLIWILSVMTKASFNYTSKFIFTMAVSMVKSTVIFVRLHRRNSHCKYTFWCTRTHFSHIFVPSLWDSFKVAYQSCLLTSLYLDI